jgi:hypothetical protein
MAVITVNVWRPKDGRAAEFVAQLSQAKKIHERLGGTVRILQLTSGPNPFSINYAVEHADGAAFGTFIDKLGADAEWQEFWAKALVDPTADPIGSSVLTDMPIP